MQRGFRILVSLLLSLALAAGLLPPSPAAAAEETLTQDEAVELLREFGVVIGDPDGNLRLGDRLTRAEAATIFVRALNYAQIAQSLPDDPPFTDVRGHWGSRFITAAERLQLMRGDGDGRFRPNDHITYAEIYTVLLRMVDQYPGGPWNPAGVVSHAQGLGIVPRNVVATAPAVRGDIFWSLALTMTQVQLEDGSNLLGRHLDKTPPVLLVDKVESPTSADRITIRGRAAGAHRVTVNGQAATFNRRTGEFSISVSLKEGVNNLVVQAVDLARNATSETVRVERVAAIAKLVVEGPNRILAKSTETLKIKALDSKGNEVKLEGLTAKLSNDLATFDVKTHRLTAGEKLGRTTLTLEAGSARTTFTFDIQAPDPDAHALEIPVINSGRAPAVGDEVTVTVRVLDEDGKLLTGDNLRSVRLTASGLSGVTITPATAQTEKGVATFKVKGTREGTVTLTATSSGLTDASRDLQFLSETRVVLTASPSSLKPDGTSTATIKATLTDKQGRSVTNRTGKDIEIELTESGTDGYLVTDWIIIPNNRSSSTENAVFQAGINPGVARITGEVVSDHSYSVQALDLPVNADLAGAKFDVTFSPSSPKPGEDVIATVRVLDSRNRLVTSGSYAFQIKLATSNNDPIVGGIPEGVSVSFRYSNYYPVDDGYKDSDSRNDPYSVVGRTEGGTAQIRLSYAKSGEVKVTVVPVAGTYDAYNDEGERGAASGSAGMTSVTKAVMFAGAPAGLKITADSRLGNDQPGASTNRAESLTLRVRVVDKDGAKIPGYKGTVTLTRTSEGDGISDIYGSNRKSTSDGEVTFTVRTTGTEGFDVYKATLDKWEATITVAVWKQRLDPPYVVAIRGVKGDEYFANYVGPDFDYMDIQLAPQPPLDPAQPHNWVIARVYRKGESSPFFTSEAIDLRNGIPIIRIPRDKLKAGEHYYQVTVDNGAGFSDRSPADEPAQWAEVLAYSTSFKLSSATYDAKSGVLTLSGSGFSTSSGAVHLDKLSLVSGSERLSLDDPAVQWKVDSSSKITLTLNDLAHDIVPDRFSGNEVYVDAQTGWYENTSNRQVAQAFPKVQVKPMAAISHAALDRGAKRLYLYGAGLKHGTVDWNLIAITDGVESVKLNVGSGSTRDRVTTHTDSQIIVTLSQGTLDALAQLVDPLEVVAETGWLYTGSSSSRAHAGADDAPVYVQVSVTRAAFDSNTGTLTLYGSGLLGNELDPAKLVFLLNTKDTNPWSPSKTGPVVAEEDEEIVIPLHPDDAKAFYDRYKNKNVFMNTREGWMTTPSGGGVAPLTDFTVLFSVR